MSIPQSRRVSLRHRILTYVGALVIISLLGSTISLYRITEVNRSLDAINRVSVPLGRLLTQMQADAEVFQRELQRGLGYSHWSEQHWRPRPIPRWITDVLQSEMERAKELVAKDIGWASPSSKAHWREWVEGVSKGLSQVQEESVRLYLALDQKNEAAATEIYPRWAASVKGWMRQVEAGVSEYDHTLRQGFSQAEGRVAELRFGLEVILVVVIMLSLLLLWMGERALRPLSELTQLAREIARRGLRKEDKSDLPELSLARSLGKNDEVSQLAREFHRMATVILEREKTVETQKHRLQEQNRLLQEIGALNENVLKSIKSILLVTNLSGRITQCNPWAAQWLGKAADEVIGTNLLSWPQIQAFPGSESWFFEVSARKIEPCTLNFSSPRIYGGSLLPLKDRAGANEEVYGLVVLLDDLTDEVDLQERLRRAENLAAVGRMSAQVAHEVRNPLHSIGLEAEMAVEMAARLGNLSLKQSLSSILGSVDRLEKITENYLKLSRLSAGEKARVDLGEVLQAVLATYSSACESQGVKVEWSFGSESGGRFEIWGDRDLLEQAFGNLLKNALQALETVSEKKITWTMGHAESGRIWVKIEDSGTGVAPEIQSRLFTPFVTTKAQGTGLGLSFVQKVLEEHGGTISYPGETHGATGACFEMRFPVGMPKQVEVKVDVSAIQHPISG